MLQKLRKHSTGWIAKIIMGLLVVVFSLWGVQSYFMSQVDVSVAHVGDLTISQQQFQDAVNNMRRQARASQGENFDPAQFSTPEFRQRVIDGLVNRALLQQTNKALGITVTDGMVRDAIAGMQAFQIQGAFDTITYQAILRQQGLTATGFQQKVRQDLTTSVIPKAVRGSALVTDADVDAYLRLSGQTRDASYIELPVPEVDSAAVTDADIQAWYQAHQDQYMSPETVTVHYLEVKASDLEVDVTPSDEAIKKRYEGQENRFVVPERRQVSHILVSVPDNASPDEQKQALAEAQAIYKKLAEGTDFATLAKEKSDDLGSRRQGGSLGWIEPGMTEGAFDEVAFSLPEDQVSEPVLTQEGYHLIKVDAIKPGHTKALAEVRDEIVHELLGSARERMYNDVAGKLVDLVYRNPNSLKAPARELELEIQSAGPFSRDGGAGIASHPDVVEAAFSAQVLTSGMSSDPIEIGDNDMVILRVANHTSAAVKPLAEVRDRVRQAVVADRIAAEASKHAQTLLASAKEAGSLAPLAETDTDLEVQQAEGVKRQALNLPPVLRTELFKMPHPSEAGPSFAAVDGGDGKYILVQLDAVHPGDPSRIEDMRRQFITSRLQQMHAAATLNAMLEAMRVNTEVKVNTQSIEDRING